MKLIVNADDFGLSRGVNYGITDAFRKGVVRSATLMPTAASFEHALELMKLNSGLGVGIHLTLTWGYPLVSGHKTLVDGDGRFHGLAYMEEHGAAMDPEEVAKEFQAQIEKVLKSGVKPTHLDSHHHVHLLKAHQAVIAKIAVQYDLPYRGEREFSADFYGDNLSEEALINILAKNQNQDFLEIMAHPGYIDPYLYRQSRYHLARMREYEILTSQKILDFVASKKIELIHYGQLDSVTA